MGLQLFWSFFKIGAFTFGGGYAMIPMIQKEVVDHKKWLQEKDIMDVVAIAETTPGPIAINAATFVGYKVDGIKGAILSTLGVVLPSFFIILLIAMFFQKFMVYEVVQRIFMGVRVAVLALMTKAFVAMFKQCPRNVISYGAAIVSFVAVLFFKVNVIVMIIIAAIAGMIYRCLRKVESR